MILLLNACKPPESRNNAIGKYVNDYEPATIHYVILKEDSTYVHYYKKYGDSSRINTGKWEFEATPVRTEITFNSWMTYGYAADYLKGYSTLVYLIKGELFFSFDVPKEMNFKKVD
jgi:hypothetical protein